MTPESNLSNAESRPNPGSSLASGKPAIANSVSAAQVSEPKNSMKQSTHTATPLKVAADPPWWAGNARLTEALS